MLVPPSPDVARTVRGHLREAGYTAAELVRRYGNTDPPIPGTPRWYRIECEADPARPGDALALWFFLGAAIRTGAARGTPEGILRRLVELGLLAERDGWLVPQVLLVPTPDAWIASDRFVEVAETEPLEPTGTEAVSPPTAAAVAPRPTGPDLRLPLTRSDLGPGLPGDPVLGVGPAAVHLHRFALRTPTPTLLDLCAGGGVLTISLLPSAKQVTATDLSRRALDFARFNLALNGRAEDTPVEILEGDAFRPVAGRRFHRIVCNPPFILTPAAPVSVGSGETLDGFCERLVRAAPAHLEEGGVFQMIFEWVSRRGEDWRERLAGWVRGTGCDAWFVQANRQSPVGYVEIRVRELDPLGATDAIGPRFRRWVRYFREHGVESVHGGFLLLRKRQGRSWIRFEDLEGELVGAASHDLLQALARFDHLAAAAAARRAPERPGPAGRAEPGRATGSADAGAGGEEEAALWQMDLRRAPSLRLSPIAVDPGPTRDAPEPAYIQIEVGIGWVRRRTVQESIATFLESFGEGTRTSEAVGRLAARTGGDPESVRGEAMRVIRHFYEWGFLEPVP